jgi:hypothetical protein
MVWNPIVVVAATNAMLLLAAPARAELPPQYTIWQDFAAVTAQEAIPTTLGLVERIERIDAGYRVRGGGGCYVDVSIKREPAMGKDGRPMPGPSRISKVDVSDKRCGAGAKD